MHTPGIRISCKIPTLRELQKERCSQAKLQCAVFARHIAPIDDGRFTHEPLGANGRIGREANVTTVCEYQMRVVRFQYGGKS